MEYETIENGSVNNSAGGQAARRAGLKRKLSPAAASGVRVALPAAVPGASVHGQVFLGVVARDPPLAPPHDPTTNCVPLRPFINNMDEITYWIYTRRAPCLMNYDNVIKKQIEAKCSKPKPKSTPSVAEEPSPKKKKKRKLSLLDEDVRSIEKQTNIYFQPSQQNRRTVPSCCKSGTLYSDVDFNIKNSSVRDKRKRIKLQKTGRSAVHKKNKVVTSTPKAATTLRRSLRRAQNGLNNNGQFNGSFDVFNSTAVTGNITIDKTNAIIKEEDEKKKNGDQNIESKNNMALAVAPKHEAAINGQFEDLSDVSGFTANYIRSTKIHSSKAPRKLRSKGGRNLMKESRSNMQLKDDSTMLICVNKSMNTTGLPKAALNCSTDSSQNIINLVTMESNGKCIGVNKGTSLLKFIDAKTSKHKESDVSKAELMKQTNKSNLNTSFQSISSSTTRYPTRHKLQAAETTVPNCRSNQMNTQRRKINKISSNFDNSDRKENPEEKTIYRTRSGRPVGLALHQHKNSVLVLSNVTDQVSSAATINVASPVGDLPREGAGKKKLQVDKSGQSLRRNSLRDQSGFAACFSDSDEDSEPLKPRKFFC